MRRGHSLRAPLPQAGRTRSSSSRPCEHRTRPQLKTPAELRSRLRATGRRSACAPSTLSPASACSKSRSGNARAAHAPRPEPQGRRRRWLEAACALHLDAHRAAGVAVSLLVPTMTGGAESSELCRRRPSLPAASTATASDVRERCSFARAARGARAPGSRFCPRATRRPRCSGRRGAAGRAFPERDLEQADAGDRVERAQADRRRVARRRDLLSAGVDSCGRRRRRAAARIADDCSWSAVYRLAEVERAGNARPASRASTRWRPLSLRASGRSTRGSALRRRSGRRRAPARGSAPGAACGWRARRRRRRRRGSW